MIYYDGNNCELNEGGGRNFATSSAKEALVSGAKRRRVGVCFEKATVPSPPDCRRTLNIEALMGVGHDGACRRSDSTVPCLEEETSAQK